MMPSFKQWRAWLPLILFGMLFFFLWRGLSLNPHQLPSALVDKPAPAFSLPSLTDPMQKVDQQIFQGKITLLNVWASWCTACRLEHPVLMDIATSKRVTLIGLDYKDSANAAKIELNNLGNPYVQVLLDNNGSSAINWGVYGTPESFLIDRNGIIRYKQIGALTPKIWQKTLLPLIISLQNATQEKIKT